jgi:hypothetical protein
VISDCSTATSCRDGCVSDQTIVYRLGVCYPGAAGSGNFLYIWSGRERRVYRLAFAVEDEECAGESVGRELVTTVPVGGGYYAEKTESDTGLSSLSRFLSNGVQYTGIR